MLRVPRLRHLLPANAREASALLAEHGGNSMAIAGGTDLVPKLKRRQFTPSVLVQVPRLDSVNRGDGWVEVGATLTLAAAESHPELGGALRGYAEAAGLVSSPPLRNAGTVGGNLLVDTRCNYYDQTHEWRRAIGFCMKRDGDICLVAPSSPRCWAVSSSDTAPIAIALGATVTLAGPDGDRQLPASDLYRDDGIDYVTKAPHEVITAVRLPVQPGVTSAYAKLRRRGSIDFPIAGCGVALKLEGGSVAWVRIVMSGVGSHPVEAPAAAEFLAGRRLDAAAVTEAAELAAGPARPLDNTDLNHAWRKKMVRVVVENALRQAAERGGQAIDGSLAAN